MTLFKPSRGFTLVELLIAVTIAGVIFAAIGTGFVQVSRGASALEASETSHGTLTDALEWMRRDLESLYIEQAPLFNPEGGLEEEDPYRFSLAEESAGGVGVARLRFTSRNHLAFGNDPKGGIAEVVYYVAEAEEGLVLRRSDRLFFDEAFSPNDEDPVALKGLTRFDVLAFEGDEEPQDEWDSDDSGSEYKTPDSLSITLEVEKGGRRFSLSNRVILRSRRGDDDDES